MVALVTQGVAGKAGEEGVGEQAVAQATPLPHIAACQNMLHEFWENDLGQTGGTIEFQLGQVVVDFIETFRHRRQPYGLQREQGQSSGVWCIAAAGVCFHGGIERLRPQTCPARFIRFCLQAFKRTLWQIRQGNGLQGLRPVDIGR